MSVRSVSSALGTVRRMATTSRLLADVAPTTPSSSSSSSSTSANTGFAALRNIFDAPSSAPSSSSSASTSYPGSTPSVGYAPESLPPSVDPTLDLLTNCLMRDGKKSDAQKMVSRILEMIQSSTNLPPQPLIRQAILLSSPSIKMLSMRKSAKTVLTPRGLTERQRSRQGVAWLLRAAERGRKGGLPRDARIAREVLAVLEGQSEVFKLLEERHKVAFLNRSNMTAR